MNNKYESGERTINLIDWGLELVSRWRVLVICAILGLIFGGVFCAYKWYKPGIQIVEEVVEEEAPTTQDKVEKLNDLTETDINVVNSLMDLYENYNAQIEYSENAPLMQLDSSKLPVVEMQFHIKKDKLQEDSNERDNISIIKAYYTKILQSEECYKRVREAVLELQNTDYYAEYLDGTNTFWKKTTNDGYLVIYSVCGNDMEMAKKIADTIVQYISECQSEAIALFGEHEFELINYNATVCNSNDLLTYQRDKLNTLTATQTSIVNQEKTLNTPQKLYYGYLNEGKDEITARSLVSEYVTNTNQQIESNTQQDIAGEPTVIALPRQIHLKYIILGIICGAALGVVYVSMQYLLTKKLRCQDNVFEMYGIPKIENVYYEKEYKGVSGKIDQWVMGKIVKRYGIWKMPEALTMICAKLELLSAQNESNKFLVIADDLNEKGNELVTSMQQKLQKKGKEVVLIDNIYSNIETIENFTDSYVLLLNTHQKESFDEFERKLELCHLFQCKIIGLITLLG